MLHFLLAATLAAVPVAARPAAPKNADFVLLVKSPRTGLPQLRAFLSQAGGYAPSLRPTALGTSLGGLLGADLFDPKGLEEAGVDLEAPLTLSFQSAGQLTCFATVGEKPAARMKATLAGAGQAASEKYQGAVLTGATVGKAWRAGFASKGKLSCIGSGAPDVLPLLRQAVAGMGKAGLGAEPRWAAATAGLAAPIVGYLAASGLSGGFELLATGTGLTLRGAAFSARALLAPAQDGDPLAALRPAAALVVGATLRRESLADPTGPAADAVRFLVHNACPRCAGASAKSFLDALAPSLFGSMALVVPRVDPSAAGAPLAQYYLFPHAYLLSLKDPAGARTALQQLVAQLRQSGVAVSEETNLGEGPHWSLELGGRRVFAGIAGNALYLSNERATRDLTLVALKQALPAKAAHALELTVNGPLAAAALRRVSILDAPKSPELAAIFAIGVEAGALLKAAGPVRGRADPEGKKLRFEIGFELPPPQAAPSPALPPR